MYNMTLPAVAAVVAFEGFARVAVRHAEAAEHGDHADTAQAGKVRAAASGAFREVIEGVQASFVALDALAVCLLTRLIFLFIKKRIIVIELFANYFSDLFRKITIFYANFKCFFKIIIMILPCSLQSRTTT